MFKFGVTEEQRVITEFRFIYATMELQTPLLGVKTRILYKCQILSRQFLTKRSCFKHDILNIRHLSTLTPRVLCGSSTAFFAASTVLYVTKPNPLHETEKEQ